MDDKLVIVVRGKPGEDSGEVLIVEDAQQYKQTIRAQGGCWMADFTLPASLQRTRTDLAHLYDSLLFHKVEVRMNGTTVWHGVIWQMDLTLYGLKKRRDIGVMWNAWKAIYTLNDDKVQRETSWFTNPSSIAQYGRREQLVYLDNVTLAQAEAKAQTELAKAAFPLSRAIGWTQQPDGLNVQCVGLAFTAQSTFCTVATPGTTAVSTFVSSIIGTDLEFLQAGTIETNTLTVEREQRTPTRCWDLLLRLAELGNGTKPFLLQVDQTGRLSYRGLDPTRVFEWHGEFGLRMLNGVNSGWTAAPGVLRDRTEQAGAPNPGSFLLDRRDIWIDEVEMWQGATKPVLKPDEYNEDDLLNAKEQYERMMSEFSITQAHGVTREGGL